MPESLAAACSCVFDMHIQKTLCVFGLAVNEMMYQGLALNGNMKSELRIGDMYEKL